MCVCVCVGVFVSIFISFKCFHYNGNNCLLFSCYLGMGVPPGIGSQPMSVSQPFWGIPPTSTVSLAPSVSTEQVRLCVVCNLCYSYV